ncbi:hypothetical protein [Arthrobacter alpinus]|uniref:hypothetical protein n=2 Tax=Arthrobacter TaxID=1663 RepID=UPI001647182B|nr:hypothetical protein [Arthrobacter alpinus]
MHAPAMKSVTLAHAAEEVFAAVVKTVEGGKFEMAAADPATLSATFSSGKTALSWGNLYIATVRPEPKGTILELVCGGVDNAPKALLDKWKNSKTADKTLAIIASNLP